MSSSSAGAREALHSENIGRRQGDLARRMLAIQGGCRAREHGRPTGKPSARCGGAPRLRVFFQGHLTQVSRIWALSKDPGFSHPRQGPMRAAVARWPRRPATRYSQSSDSSGAHAGLCCGGLGIFTVLVVGVLVLRLLFPSFVRQDSKQTSTTYQP